uniref:Uncharacterized protein TCIL3000_7_2070 n=1 Tax=Trypanosoma congolense (strain IL3000) TaxID=1068625 RepID=G0UPT6_TRYCI|nr:unnamed protein product [Trypanosoma congolense IL3000]
MRKVGEYEVLETIGTGSFSKVKLVLHIPTNVFFVAKIVQKTNHRVETDIRLEISILRRLRHRNIVQLVEILESSNNYYIILEPVLGGDMCSLILSHERGLDEGLVAHLFFQLVAGLHACHQNGVAHRDLKPENLLLTGERVLKISDFGLSRLHAKSYFHAKAEEYAHTLTGTLAYVSPEVLDGSYDAFKADIWSLGCILYVMLTGQFPFGPANDACELGERIRDGKICEMPRSVSEGARGLTMWLLSRDPTSRPSLDEVATHRFLRQQVPMRSIMVLTKSRRAVILAPSAEEFSTAIPEGDEKLSHASSLRPQDMDCQYIVL